MQMMSIGGGRHVRVGKGIGMGFFAAPLSHLVPGLLLVGQQHHLRQKLVDRAPQTVVVAPRSACRGWREGVNWAELGDWGGMLGLRVTGLSGWGKAYQKEARPTTNMSTSLKILTLHLTSPMSADFGTCDTSGLRRDSSTTRALGS